MGEFFGSIYCFLFEDWFSLDLANYLWGVASPEQVSNIFIGFGLSMVLISLFIAILYYYIIDNSKFAKWWGWSIALIVDATVNFIIGWQRTLMDYDSGLMKMQDGTPLNVSPVDCINFGFINAIIAIVCFILFSFIIKWKSPNCAHTPI